MIVPSPSNKRILRYQIPKVAGSIEKLSVKLARWTKIGGCNWVSIVRHKSEANWCLILPLWHSSLTYSCLIVPLLYSSLTKEFTASEVAKAMLE